MHGGSEHPRRCISLVLVGVLLTGVAGIEPAPKLLWRQFGRHDLTPMESRVGFTPTPPSRKGRRTEFMLPEQAGKLSRQLPNVLL